MSGKLSNEEIAALFRVMNSSNEAEDETQYEEANDSSIEELKGGSEVKKNGGAYNPIGRTEGAVRGLSEQIISMYERGYKDGKVDAEISMGGIIRVGETYRIDNYQAVCVSKDGDRCLMQTLGMTAGPWPGEGDISDYDDKIKEFCKGWSAAVSNMRLLTKEEVTRSDIAHDAITRAANNRDSFGADFYAAWLGSVGGSFNAWFVNSNGDVYGDGNQYSSFVVAPAFNLDESKIILDGDEIKLKPSTDKKHHDEFDEAWEAVKTICPELVELENATDETDKEAYQRGLDDAWDAARKISLSEDEGGFTLEEVEVIFDKEVCIANIVRNNTASEAIAKIRAWEEKKVAENEIKVGDEVRYSTGNIGVVVNARNNSEGSLYRCVRFDGELSTETKGLIKTGRYFPQIAEVLKAMQEGE